MLSFLIDNLYQSQQSFMLIAELNKTKSETIVFVENLSPFCLRPSFPVMQAAEAWARGGTMIATTPSTANKLLTFPGPERKIFYSWDLYWLRGQQRMYEPYMLLYTNPDLEVVARSESHARAIENAFNIKVAGIVENFRLDQFEEVLRMDLSCHSAIS
jgi:hypothetical protein